MKRLGLATELAIAAVLSLLMIATRGTHWATIDALPSASWAVFFVAGVFLRPAAFFALFFALASAIDFALLGAGRISDWCVSPAYWALLPAYGALWSAGRLYARAHRDRAASLLPLGLCLIGGASLAYLCSGGGFYFFSGRYPDPTLAGFLPRVAHYLPSSLGTLALYVGFAAIAHVALRAARGDALGVGT
ncbi:MAG: hypothetical protein K0Q76_1560 [Panacagrimonas sp.]|jgi:hypothetical protein|nr:hypothetical protein [Panacagrimonas sp.]MCC2656452.1 hypothetical protein [Panacagrimonas sp.]